MRIGVDYYPEQWNPELWQKDIDLMAETGVKVVRLAEFAWSTLEPDQNKFNFLWLDTVITMLEEKNIQIVLGTPTNCPPLWFYEKYPEAVQTDTNGNRIAIGIRGHRCYRNPDFRICSSIIINRMASRYQNHKSIIAWQIDNELEANFCRCSNCSSAFRSYLREKYRTLDAINEAYGNSVWSGRFSDWSQVKPPMGNYQKSWYNPSLMLDYYRFAAKDTVEYVRFQIECIRKYFPDVSITTNTWFCENCVDFHELFKQFDFVSYDNYPATSIPNDPEELYSHAFHLDFMRGIKRQNFWIMEQLSGGLGSWAPMSRTTLPNMIKGYALQAFAHGADTVIHFRWRTAASGAEMFWHGLIDHSNCPGRRFREFRELCKEAETLSDIIDSQYISETAILYDADNDFALKIQPQTDGFYYLQQLKLFHDACMNCGVNTDIISAHESLERYRVIIAPAMYITHNNIAEKLYSFAENGGTLILSTRSGVKNKYNNCIMDVLPSVYQNLVGAFVEEYDPIGYSSSEIEMQGQTYHVSQWCDILKLTTAESAANYTKEFYAGAPAVSKNCCGKGTAYYVGVVGERKFYRNLLRQVFTDSGIHCLEQLPTGIEISTRRSDTALFRFIFNNTDRDQEFPLDKKFYSLKPFEMKIERMKYSE